MTGAEHLERQPGLRAASWSSSRDIPVVSVSTGLAFDGPGGGSARHGPRTTFSTGTAPLRGGAGLKSRASRGRGRRRGSSAPRTRAGVPSSGARGQRPSRTRRSRAYASAVAELGAGDRHPEDPLGRSGTLRVDDVTTALADAPTWRRRGPLPPPPWPRNTPAALAGAGSPRAPPRPRRQRAAAHAQVAVGVDRVVSAPALSSSAAARSDRPPLTEPRPPEGTGHGHPGHSRTRRRSSRRSPPRARVQRSSTNRSSALAASALEFVVATDGQLAAGLEGD